MGTLYTRVILHNRYRHAQNTDSVVWRTHAVWSHILRIWENIFGGYHYSVVCLTTGPKSFPHLVGHRVWCASSLNFQYPRVFFRSNSSCLRLLPHVPVTSSLPSALPSIKCSRRRFRRNCWPIQWAFFLFIVRRIFLSFLTLCCTYSFSHDLQNLKSSQVLLNYFPKCSIFNITQS